MKISSHSVGCLSFCWWPPLTVQTLFVWLLLPLPEETDQKILLRHKSKSVLPMLFPGNFKVSGLRFRSLIQFWVYFCIWWEVFWLYHFICGYPVLPAPFVEETAFSPLCVLVSFRVDWSKCLVFIYGFPTLFLWLLCMFLCQYRTVLIILLSSTVWSWVWYLQLCSSLSHFVLAIWVFSWFHINFSFSSVEKISKAFW